MTKNMKKNQFKYFLIQQLNRISTYWSEGSSVYLLYGTCVMGFVFLRIVSFVSKSWDRRQKVLFPK